MDQQQLITILVGLASLFAGAVVGGGSVLVIYGRAVKSILASPVIMKSFEELAKSWPAPIREAVADTGRFLEEVADDKPTSAPAAISPVTLMPVVGEPGSVG